MPPAKPIFVVGSGRSGTTLFFRMITGHPELGWLTNFSNRVPALPALAAFSRITSLQKIKLFKPASEGIHGYRHCGIEPSLLPGAEGELPANLDEIRERLHRYFDAHASAWGRDRIVSKNTSNSVRIRLLQAIYPDAYFIHVHRHPYAVISSLLNVSFWPDLPLWWSDHTPREWEAQGGHPHSLAAQHWVHQVSAILDCKSQLAPNRYLEVGYENFVASPDTEIERVMAFADLERPAAFDQHVASLNIRAGSLGKWKAVCSGEDLAKINPIVAATSERLGYSLEQAG